MPCLFCKDKSYQASYMLPTYFNGKKFEYRKCKSCDLIYVYPLPDEKDYHAMYPTSYQGGVDFQIHEHPEKKLPGLRLSYAKHWELIETYAPKGAILDYGCGSANFIINLLNREYSCDGAEYNPDHVSILKQQIPNADFFTIQEVLSSTFKKRYDVIRLSNVFEHLENPTVEISQLKSLLTENGILLVEGPLEDNLNLAWWVRKQYFRLKKIYKQNHLESHSPTHIVFTNAKNQKAFFEKIGLNTLCFEVSESEWPFPSKEFVVSFGDKIKYWIAQISILFSHFNKSWGNTFIYVGKK